MSCRIHFEKTKGKKETEWPQQLLDEMSLGSGTAKQAFLSISPGGGSQQWDGATSCTQKLVLQAVMNM